MPRRARIDAPGALHHIISRGIERCLIFQDDADYGNFLDRLGVAAEASRRLKLSIAGVSLWVKRGEIIAQDHGYSLVD